MSRLYNKVLIWSAPDWRLGYNCPSAMETIETALQEKYYNLRQALEDLGSALLAFSGGVDSTLVLAVAREALGDNILAATVHSPLHPKSQLEMASTIAARLKVEHITIAQNELESEEFTANPPERCYLCKHDRFSKLVEMATREGIAEVIDGTQLDDTGDYRPGLEAARELGIRSPLLETGFVKYEVRALSRSLGLSTWNMAPSTCLATRMPYGQSITREKLAVVEEGEEFLSEVGLSNVRLRFIEDRTARIEVSPSSLSLIVSDGVRERVLAKMKGLGFVYTTIDLAGYRMGALNEAIQHMNK